MSSNVQFWTWPVMCVLLVIFIITYHIGMSRIQRRYIPIEDIDYFVKRALFISYISLSEIMFALLINIEEALQIQFVVFHASPPMRDVYPEMPVVYLLYCLSHAVLAGVLLSISRCLAQRFALAGLSKSDIVSMTRVYLVPSTCVVTALCVSSWFQLWGQVEQGACDLDATSTSQMTTVRSSRIAYCVYFLVGIFVTMLHDFIECRSDDTNSSSSRQFDAYLTVDLQQILSNERAVVGSNLSNSKTTACFTKPAAAEQDGAFELKYARRIVPSPRASPGRFLPEEATLICGQISHRTKTSFCDLFFDFLRQFTRLFISVTVYGVLVLLVYEHMERMLVNSAFEDFRTGIFTAMLAINGVMRIVQIQASESLEEQTKHKKISINDLPAV